MTLLAARLITSVPIAVVYNFFVDRFLSGFHSWCHQVRRFGA